MVPVVSSTGGSSLATHNPAFIGGNMDETITHDNNTSANNFIGIIDNVTIWNRALSTQEIQQLYTSSNYTYSWLPNVKPPHLSLFSRANTTYTVDATMEVRLVQVIQLLFRFSHYQRLI